MRYFFLLLLIPLLFGCGSEIDKQLQDVIQYHQLTGNPISDEKSQVVDIKSPRANLGKLLFFTKSLSGRKDVACASCHHPFIGGDDDLSLSIGVDPIIADKIGIERENFNNQVLVPRNAPTTFNSSLWKKRLFHDGRVERLNPFNEHPAQISTPDEKFGEIDPNATSLVQAQAGFPVTSEHEMRNNYLEKSSNKKLRLALVSNIIESIHNYTPKKGISWEVLFRDVFKEKYSALNELITFQRILELLADYEKSQIFIDTEWKQYIEGNSSVISRAAKRGALIFYKSYEEGGGGCASCHAGDFFTDEEFHILAIPQIGFGVELNGDDRGRYLRTGILDDRYAFRTPSLLNVELTAPYGHNGAYDTLEEIIRHHLNPKKAVSKYDFSLKTLSQRNIPSKNSKKFTQKALYALSLKMKAGLTPLKELELSTEKVSDIIEFLKTLTDSCAQDNLCLQKWVPLRDEPNPDGFILFFSHHVQKL